jgi:hypothetical protein
MEDSAAVFSLFARLSPAATIDKAKIVAISTVFSSKKRTPNR